MPNIFELNVNINTTGESEAEKALNDTTNGSIEVQQDSGSDATSKGKNIAAAIGVMSIQKVSQIGNQIASYEINKIGTIYGDQARQNEINNIMTVANTLTGIVSSTITGAAVGGLPGAIVGFVLNTASEVIQAGQRVEQYNIQQRDHMLNSNYKLERLGMLTASKGR